MREGLDVRHFFVDDVHDFLESFEDEEGLEIFTFERLLVQHLVEVEGLLVAVDLEERPFGQHRVLGHVFW